MNFSSLDQLITDSTLDPPPSLCYNCGARGLVTSNDLKFIECLFCGWRGKATTENDKSTQQEIPP
jgi:hypothetical protein